MKKLVSFCIVCVSLVGLAGCFSSRNPTSPDGAALVVQPTRGVCIGNSTVANYRGGAAVASLLFTREELAQGYSCQSLAVPGHTIDQQLERWQSLPQKDRLDWIIVEIGLNDLDPGDPLEATLQRYQRLIDTINRSKPAKAKLIIATMTPLRERLKDIYRGKGNASYKKWVAMNDAIMGKGKIPITGVDFRFNEHTLLLADKKGNLKPEYEIAEKDHVHQNTAARLIVASTWRVALAKMGMLTP